MLRLKRYRETHTLLQQRKEMKPAVKLLQELITVTQLSDMAPTIKEADLSYGAFKTKKGVMGKILQENANLRMAAEKLKENITEINSEFKEEVRNIEDES